MYAVVHCCSGEYTVRCCLEDCCRFDGEIGFPWLLENILRFRQIVAGENISGSFEQYHGY